MRSRAWSARAAAYRYASVQALISRSASSTTSRTRSAAGVPPGSRVKYVGGCRPLSSCFRMSASVDLPEKSRPSMVTKRPRGAGSTRRFLRCGAPEGVAFGGLDVGPEEVAMRRVLPGFAHRLGVPLDGQDPTLRQVPVLDALDHPVRGAGDRAQRGGKVLYRLVVVGVHPKRVRSHHARHPGVPVHLDLVRPLPLRRGLAVRDQVGVQLAGQVLIQRPPKGNVQDLQPAAYPENGDAKPQRVLDQRHLERVALRDGRPELRRMFLAVIAGIQVASPAQHEPIYPPRHLPCGLGDGWQYYRYSPGLGYACNVIEVGPHERAQRPVSDRVHFML